MILTYDELISLETFKERFEYLLLNGQVGEETFGSSRYLNQNFYRSAEWRNLRNYIAVRDDGCDLAHPDHPVSGRFFVHHMNPITETEIIRHSGNLLDPDQLILVSFDTHNALHYGSYDNVPDLPTVRSRNDTTPWL